MKKAVLSILGVGAIVTSVLGAPGCGSSSDDGAGATAAGQPPARPDAPATTSTTKRNFAIAELFLGDTDTAYAASGDAWKKFGYNLDKIATTGASTDSCSPVGTSSKSDLADGDNGVDNAFGNTIMKYLVQLKATSSKQVTDGLKKGDFTVMMNVAGLTDDPSQSATGLSGEIFAGGKFEGGAPTFTPADDWPVRPELLSGGKLEGGSLVKLTNGFVKDGVYVSGDPTDVQLSLSFGGVAIQIAIHHAVISFKHSAPSEAIDGVVAGVIDTEELVEVIAKAAPFLTSSACPGSSLLDTIKEVVRSASDIMSDGSNKAGVPCNGISIGIGFRAKEIGQPTKVAKPAEAATDKCAEQEE